MIKLYGQVVPKRLFGSVRVESKAHNGKFQAKLAEPSTEDQTIVADSGYDALSLVTVKGATLQEKTVTPSSMEQTVIPDVGVFGLAKVIVEAIGTQGTVRISEVNISESYDTFIITFEDGTSISGYVSFNADGLPVYFDDNAGNTVEFSDGGYPVIVKDGYGNTIPIVWG